MLCASTCSAEDGSKHHVQYHLLLSHRNDWTGNSDLSFLRSSVRTLKVGQFTGWLYSPSIHRFHGCGAVLLDACPALCKWSQSRIVWEGKDVDACSYV